MLTSVYAYWPYLIFVLLVFGIALISLVAATVVLARRCTMRTLTPGAMTGCAAALLAATVLINFGIAIVVGFDEMHPAVGAVLCVIVLVLLLPPALSLVGGTGPYWRYRSGLRMLLLSRFGAPSIAPQLLPLVGPNGGLVAAAAGPQYQFATGAGSSLTPATQPAAMPAPTGSIASHARRRSRDASTVTGSVVNHNNTIHAVATAASQLDDDFADLMVAPLPQGAGMTAPSLLLGNSVDDFQSLNADPAALAVAVAGGAAPIAPSWTMPSGRHEAFEGRLYYTFFDPDQLSSAVRAEASDVLARVSPSGTTGSETDDRGSGVSRLTTPAVSRYASTLDASSAGPVARGTSPTRSPSHAHLARIMGDLGRMEPLPGSIRKGATAGAGAAAANPPGVLKAKLSLTPGQRNCMRPFLTAVSDPTARQPLGAGLLTDHGDAVCCDPAPASCGAYVMAWLSLWVADVGLRPGMYAIALLIGLVCAVMSLFPLYGMCVCNKPMSASTWLSRKATGRKYCVPNGDKPCWSYPLVGAGCDSMIVASHLVIESDDQMPVRAQLVVCSNATLASLAIEGGVCALGAPGAVVVAGELRSNDNINEDRRYIANYYVAGLECGAPYTVIPQFVRADGTVVSAEPVCFWSLPNATTGATRDPLNPRNDPSSPAASLPVSSVDLQMAFVAGGDYVPLAGIGLRLLLRAMAQLPHASFIYIGGDVSYDNNVRRCFGRVDAFFAEFLSAATRTSDTCLVPLTTSIGNHDAGGYQYLGADVVSTPAGRDEAVQFYLKYFPHLDPSDIQAGTGIRATRPQDWTTTFRTMRLSSTVTWVGADSGHLAAFEDQQAKLEAALSSIAAAGEQALVTYHVPAYPSTRATEDNNAERTRAFFLPVLDAHDATVTLVFENHDHNYKRTARIRDGVFNNVSELDVLARRPGRGIVFTGDGALGASSFAPLELEAPFLARGFSGNYVHAAMLLRNGSVWARSLDMDGVVRDEFLAP